MTRLKPCPFCGAIAHIGELKKSLKSPRYIVHCSNTKGDCIASRSDVFGRHYYSEMEAADAWNRRAEHG